LLTGFVGRNFQHALEGAFEFLSPYSEEAAAVEVSYYQEDGRMSTAGYLLAQRRMQSRDAAAAHDGRPIGVARSSFGDAEIGEVHALVNQLFARRAAEAPQDRTQVRPAARPGKSTCTRFRYWKWGSACPGGSAVYSSEVLIF